MPATLRARQLFEERAPIGRQITDLVDRAHKEKREFNAEEQQQYEDLNKRYDAFSKQIDTAKRADAIEKELSEPAGDDGPGKGERNGRRQRRSDERGRKAPTEEDRNIALQAWCRRQYGKPLNKRQREACERTGMNPGRRNLDIVLRTGRGPASLQEARTLSAITKTAGGVFVAEGFVANLEVALLTYSNVRTFADVMRTDTGAELPWPTANDTGNEGEIVGENPTINSADPTTDHTTFHAYKFTSKFVKVPSELFDDSAFNVASMLGSMLGERLARGSNRKYTVGTGRNQPTGFVTRATVGKTGASQTAISVDDVLDLEHSVDPAYRMGAAWMLHDNILLLLRKLKDGEGRPLWQQSMTEGAPDRLNGYPIGINQHMADAAIASAKTLAFGQFKKFKIRDVGTIRLRRLVERFADSDQEGFVAFLRTDSNLLDAGTHPLKVFQQAA